MIFKLRGKIVDPTLMPRKWNKEVLDASKATSSLGEDIPVYDTRLALDELITALKDEGIWALLDTFANFAYNTGTGLQKYRMYDFKKGGFYTPFGGLAFTNSGVEGNALDAYIGTNFVFSTDAVNFQINNASLGTILYKEQVDNAILMGMASSTFHIFSNNNSAVQRICRNANATENLDFSSTGLIVLGRKESEVISRTQKENYQELEDQLAANSAGGTNELLILRRAAILYGNAGMAISFAGSNLSQSQAQAVRTHYNAYLQKIGLTQFA